MLTSLLAARAQMGTSLGFHIIFAIIGVGLPLLLVFSEGLYLRTKNPAYLALAKKWGQATAILFAVGAVSGTTLSFELGLLWPGFMKFATGIIGMPFSLEGFAFFIEGIFLGLYLYGRKRLSPVAHWLTTIPLALSGTLSAIFILSANGWMNNPTGFKIINGQVTDVDPLQAMLNPAWGVEALHMTLAAYMSVGFGVAAIYAIAILRGKNDTYHKRGLALGLILACVITPLQFISGDLNAKYLAHYQQTKLAAMEGQFVTQRCAPERLGGLPDPATRKTNFAIEIPCGLSILAYDDPNAMVKGLDDPSFKGLTPNPVIVHLAFQVMVGIGSALLALVAWVAFAWWRKKGIPDEKWLMRALVLAGPLPFLAVESGWTVTEVGRQPWVVYGFLKTKDAVTPAPGLQIEFFGFTLLYIALAGITVWLLLRLAAENAPVADDDRNTSGDKPDRKGMALEPRYLQPEGGITLASSSGVASYAISVLYLAGSGLVLWLIDRRIFSWNEQNRKRKKKPTKARAPGKPTKKGSGHVIT